jgi:hypothetical protein
MRRYPIINGAMPPIEPIVEYQIVTGAGIVSCVFDEKPLAVKRFREINNPTWKLIEVIKRVREITPGAKLQMVA